MDVLQKSDTTQELLENLHLDPDYSSKELEWLERGESRYLRDLRVNFKNATKAEHLTEKEVALLGLCIATNNENDSLQQTFVSMAKEAEATDAEIAESIACASLLAANNVLYRFRHFVGKESYEKMPARLKMNIMMRPETGKAFFELMSLAVSAVNGCEACVRAHEASLLELEVSEEKIFESVRLASVVRSLDRIFQ